MIKSHLDFIQKRELQIEKIVNDIANKKAKIIDDFLKAYCASRDFKAKDIRKLKLIMRQLPYSEGGYGGYEYTFELKRGREKTQI